jgi:hypothetical protein
MAIVEGDRFKDRSTGQVYKVRRIKGGTVILEAEDNPNKFWMGDGILDLFFESVKSQKKRSC